MTRILLIRHGESEWNAAGRWQGHANPPLSARGVRQASLAVLPFELFAVWSSPFIRASRTAEILAATTGTSAALDPRLRERDAGMWTGLTRDEIEARWPGFLASGLRPDGFEPDDLVAARALEVLQEIGAACDGAALVVSHGGLIRVVERALGADAPPVPNLAGRELLVDGPTVMLGERVLLLDPARVDVTTPDLL